MKRSNGLHFYINVENINQIVLDEETHTGAVNHSIHALDTFFSTIESYGKEKYPNSFNVEKITGGRLHLFVVDKVCSAFEVVKDVSSYAFQVSRIINKEIPKYRTIDDFKIQIGAAYGRFYMFEFTAKDGFSEETSIGYAANFAAKLQALASVSSLTISKDIYEGIMEDDKKLFHKVSDRSLSKPRKLDAAVRDHFASLMQRIADNPEHLHQANVIGGDFMTDGVKCREILRLNLRKGLVKPECRAAFEAALA